jgi:hypothetical protein
MNTILQLSTLAVLLVAPSRCFALWTTVAVSKERAKELGMEVRSKAAGPNQVRVELEFKTEGKFEAFSPDGKFKKGSRVELRIRGGGSLFGDNASVTAPLQEDRSKLEDDAKVLAGKWESAPKGAGRVVLQFEPGKAKTTFSLTAELYDTRAKEPKLVDSDRAEIELQDDMGKRFFIREGTKVSYVLKDKKLVLDGEYEAKGTLYLLTGEWKKVEEKKVEGKK